LKYLVAGKFHLQFLSVVVGTGGRQGWSAG
jgi:hypothetical protein